MRLLLLPLILIRVYAQLDQWIRLLSYGTYRLERSIRLLRVMRDKSCL